MVSRSFFLLFLTLLSGRTLPTSAQQQPSRRDPGTQVSDDRGLLLGMYFPNSATWEMLRNAGTENKWVPEISLQPHGKYLTFWISRRKGEVTIKPVEGLLMPRKDGFWRIGSQIVKSGDAEDADFDEQFWAAPNDKKEPQPAKTDREIDGKSTRLITYAGPKYISYLLHWQGGAGLWEYQQAYVSALDNLTTQLTISRVLGPQAGAVYKKLAKSLNHMNDDVREREACNCCSGADNEWGLIHVGDEWQAYARFHEGTSSACSQGAEDHVLKTLISRSLWSGGRSDRLPWDSLRKQAESALKVESGSVQHLFFSPGLELAISVGTTGLAVLEVTDKSHFSVAKKLPFASACIPVSEQWSVGKFVGVWDTEMQKQKMTDIPKMENP